MGRMLTEHGVAQAASAAAVHAFRRSFGGAPSHVASAPGRVNLIGEHTDYNGLAVLPMAIQFRVYVAFRRRDDTTVQVTSTAPGFEPHTFTLVDPLPPYPLGDWGNYVKAACQTLLRAVGAMPGVDATIHSDVPVAAGLSSSSALVVACAVALLEASGRQVPPLVLARLLAEGERYVGTQGGGMDQAIALGGRSGSAARIGFDPLSLRLVPVPAWWRFVVANSLVRAEKSGAAQETYNRRTAECRAALQRVVAYLGARDVACYVDLRARYADGELLKAGAAVLDPTLRRRFRHVISEATRVDEAVGALEAAALERFGRLMAASHASLRDDYEVSCPELDALVDVARAGGAAGARLTGAGLGGSIVALVSAGREDDLLQELAVRFYRPRGHDQALRSPHHAFVARPSDGATVAAV
jgi:galactokinase